MVAYSRRRGPNGELPRTHVVSPRNGRVLAHYRSVPVRNQTTLDVTEFSSRTTVGVVSGTPRSWRGRCSVAVTPGQERLLIQSGMSLAPRVRPQPRKSAVSVNRYSLTLILDDSDSLRVAFGKETRSMAVLGKMLKIDEQDKMGLLGTYRT